MAKGGARIGAGRKKGSTNLITINALRAAMDTTLGIPFEQMLANMTLKLYNDFQNDVNVDTAAKFIHNVANRLLQPVPQVIETEITVADLDTDEVNNRLANLLTRQALSIPAEEPKAE